MAPRIVVDPMTRIEGHLRIEAETAGGRISEAYASCTMWRGMEVILKGRDPGDAWAFTQRACGVCTTVHALASVRAVENALDYPIPTNANLLRNLVAGFQYVQDHVVHFYALHALDWVDVVSALSADPAETARIAQSISAWPKSSAAYFRTVQQRVQQFVNSGQLGIFTNGTGVTRRTSCRRRSISSVSPITWNAWIGSVRSSSRTPSSAARTHIRTGWWGAWRLPSIRRIRVQLNAEEFSKISQAIDRAVEFVEQVYLPDLVAVAGFYRDWAAIGGGARNYLACGDFPPYDINDTESLYFPRGVIVDRNLSEVQEFDPAHVSEYVTHSWYSYAAGDEAGLHPYDGETEPNYTGPEPPYDQLNVEGKYSWLKSPRYMEMPMEVGPLARMLIAYASGHDDARELVAEVLGRLDAPATA